MEGHEMYEMLENEYLTDEDKLQALEDMGYIEIKRVTMHQYFNPSGAYIGDDYNDMAIDICEEISYSVSKEEFAEKLKELNEDFDYE